MTLRSKPASITSRRQREFDAIFAAKSGGNEPERREDGILKSKRMRTLENAQKTRSERVRKPQ